MTRWPATWTTWDSARGIATAIAVIGAWAGSLAMWWWVVDWSSAWLWAPAAVALQTFLSTGLFITAHDAMHQTICPERPRLNRALGALALRMYAAFSIDRLQPEHHLHHASPASQDDPDFHDGDHPGFWRWYARFLWNYATLGQIAWMALAYNVWAHAVGVEEWKLVVFWVVPALASTVQLFFFGTYLPHRDGEYSDEHRARSSRLGVLASFLTCYHFGFHWEHHAYPHVPWWKLPQVHKHHASMIVNAPNKP